jgi:hypothetical protein
MNDTANNHTTQTSGTATFEIQNTPANGIAKGAGDARHAGSLEEFTPQQSAWLRAARERYLRGDLNDWSGDYKRLRFARWLYEQGHLSDYPEAHSRTTATSSQSSK